MDSDAILLILELLTWVGLVPGITFLIIGYTRLVLASRYEQTWGIVIPSPAGTDHPWFRWMDLQREFQSAPVPFAGEDEVTIGEEVEVYFNPRSPEKGRLDDPTGDGRPLRVIGWLLVLVGAGAGIAQLALIFSGQ